MGKRVLSGYWKVEMYDRIYLHSILLKYYTHIKNTNKQTNKHTQTKLDRPLKKGV